MKTIVKIEGEGKKKRTLGRERIVREEEYKNLDRETKVELIPALIPLGLMSVAAMWEKEVEELAGIRYCRVGGQPDWVRHGKNPGSVKLAGPRPPLSVPRVRNQRTQEEVPLETWKGFQGSGEVDERGLKRVLYGISCRNYAAAAEAIPGAIGLSKSTGSRHFLEASAKPLKEFTERDLSSYALVAIFLDGKTFAEDTRVIALGVTIEGEKVLLGFTQAGTENGAALTAFLQELRDRGLRIDLGVLVGIDGSQGIRAAVKKAFQDQAIVQRRPWHKRENGIKYLPKNEPEGWRKKLQRAHNQATTRKPKARG